MGGAGEALLPGLNWLVQRIGSGASILVVPQAWPVSRFDECLATMRTLLAATGVEPSRVGVARDLKTFSRRLAHHAAVFLCGGNTFRLLAAMQSSGFISALDSYRRNGVVAGNSAGAIVLGRSIHHAHDA
ncbi:MAG: Type 1 glutamine amidotransferase-like domain-containing protein [Vicinamibacterales bacterium]